jgi:hypothetical protein
MPREQIRRPLFEEAKIVSSTNSLAVLERFYPDGILADTCRAMGLHDEIAEDCKMCQQSESFLA